MFFEKIIRLSHYFHACDRLGWKIFEVEMFKHMLLKGLIQQSISKTKKVFILLRLNLERQ